MGLRQAINQKPQWMMTAAALLVVAGVGLIVWQALADDTRIVEDRNPRLFFSADDGKTWTPAAASEQFADFSIDGREACLAHVFECDRTRTRFVGYLERWTPEAKTAIRDQSRRANAAGASGVGAVDQVMTTGRQVKRPGAAEWSRMSSPAGEKVMEITCPDGKGDRVREVRP